jgi:hypothetical protein
MLRLIGEAGLKISPEKCEWGTDSMLFLGVRVSAAGNTPDPGKVEAVVDCITPTNVKEVRAFYGLASYYRRWIANFASIARPLSELLKAGADFEWGPRQEAAFQQLKAALTSEPILKRPDFSKPFILQTDWQPHAVAAILAQKGDDGKSEHVIAYASRVLKGAELRYPPVEGECLALVWAVMHFRHYLYGAEFEVHTDHNALRYLLSTVNLTGRLARWGLVLSEFWIKDIIYRPGPTHHYNVDGLTRLPAAVSQPPALPKLEEGGRTAEPPGVTQDVCPQPGTAEPASGGSQEGDCLLFESCLEFLPDMMILTADGSQPGQPDQPTWSSKLTPCRTQPSSGRHNALAGLQGLLRTAAASSPALQQPMPTDGRMNPPLPTESHLAAPSCSNSALPAPQRQYGGSQAIPCRRQLPTEWPNAPPLLHSFHFASRLCRRDPTTPPAVGDAVVVHNLQSDGRIGRGAVGPMYIESINEAEDTCTVTDGQYSYLVATGRLRPLPDLLLHTPAAGTDATDPKPRKHEPIPVDLPCEVCGSPDDDDVMLVCDQCNKGYHLWCLEPPLTRIPKGDWSCEGCQPPPAGGPACMTACFEDMAADIEDLGSEEGLLEAVRQNCTAARQPGSAMRLLHASQSNPCIPGQPNTSIRPKHAVMPNALPPQHGSLASPASSNPSPTGNSGPLSTHGNLANSPAGLPQPPSKTMRLFVISDDGSDLQGNREEPPAGQEPERGDQEEASEEEEEESSLDITCDQAVLDYLQEGTYPPGASATEKKRIRRRAAGYLFQDGQLYKKACRRHGPRRVPAVQDREELIRRAHDEMGHFGQQRTMHLLQRRFYWRGLTQQVKEYVRSCAACQADNPQFPRNDSLQSIPPQSVWHRLGMDLIGPLPESANGNTYVVTAVEYATRFGAAGALPDRRSETVARWLAQYIGTHSCPQIIQTDRGGEFQGRFDELCQKCLIDHRLSSAYTPNVNGLCEKFNDTVGKALRRHAQADPSTWDEHLPWIVLGYNASIQASTRHSPFRLLYGREPSLPLDNLLPPPRPAEGTDLTLTDAEVEARERAQQEQTQQALANIERAQAQQQLDYQQRRAHKPRTLCLVEGEMVMERHEAPDGKLSRKADGPFRFLQYTNADRTVCLLEDSEGRQWRSSAQRIRRFVQRKRKQPATPAAEANTTKEQESAPRTNSQGLEIVEISSEEQQTESDSLLPTRQVLSPPPPESRRRRVPTSKARDLQEEARAKSAFRQAVALAEDQAGPSAPPSKKPLAGHGALVAAKRQKLPLNRNQIPST